MEIKYHVIWIDDEHEKMSSFVKFCKRRGIEIETSKTQLEGLNKYGANPSFWDAIILDAKSLDQSENEAARIGSLFKAVTRIQKDFDDVPYFIFTGQADYEKDENFKQYCELTPTKRYYKKGDHNEELCEDIIKAIEEKPLWKIKSKYSEVFDWLPIELTDDIIEIVGIVEKEEHTNVDVFNKIRKVLDWIMRKLNQYGILAVNFNGSNLSACSTFLGSSELQKYIPQYIQRSFHSSTDIANEGSHRLRTDKDVRSGIAPFVVRSTVYELLNILVWYNQITSDDETVRQIANIAVNLTNKSKINDSSQILQVSEYEGKDFNIEQDEKGNFHCGRCRLSYNDAQRHLGELVTLYDVVDNDKPSKDRYPYYAIRFKVKNPK